MRDYHLIPVAEKTEDGKQVYALHSMGDPCEHEGTKVVIVSALRWQLLQKELIELREESSLAGWEKTERDRERRGGSI